MKNSPGFSLETCFGIIQGPDFREEKKMKADLKVADIRKLAKKYKKTRVVLLMIDDDHETLEYVSYGENRQMCASARKLADALYDAAYKFLEESEL